MLEESGTGAEGLAKFSLMTIYTIDALFPIPNFANNDINSHERKDSSLIQTLICDAKPDDNIFSLWIKTSLLLAHEEIKTLNFAKEATKISTNQKHKCILHLEIKKKNPISSTYMWSHPNTPPYYSYLVPTKLQMTEQHGYICTIQLKIEIATR